MPGGGVVFLRALAVVDSLKLKGDEKIGAEIIRRACARRSRNIE
jgi:chaperonin GroEL